MQGRDILESSFEDTLFGDILTLYSGKLIMVWLLDTTANTEMIFVFQGGGSFLMHENPDIVCLQETKVRMVCALIWVMTNSCGCCVFIFEVITVLRKFIVNLAVCWTGAIFRSYLGIDFIRCLFGLLDLNDLFRKKFFLGNLETKILWFFIVDPDPDPDLFMAVWIRSLPSAPNKKCLDYFLRHQQNLKSFQS